MILYYITCHITSFIVSTILRKVKFKLDYQSCLLYTVPIVSSYRYPTMYTLPYEIPQPQYPGLLYSNHTLSYPNHTLTVRIFISFYLFTAYEEVTQLVKDNTTCILYPQPIPCPTPYYTYNHIRLYPTLPYILYPTLPYLSVPYILYPKHNHTTITPYPTTYTLSILNPTHTLLHHIPIPYSTHTLLCQTYIYNPALPIPYPNTYTYLTLSNPAHSLPTYPDPTPPRIVGVATVKTVT